MAHSSPLRQALQTVWRRPLLALAEAAWQAAFLFGTGILLALSLGLIGERIEVTPGTLALARLHPNLAAAGVLAQVLPLLARVLLIVVPAGAVLWVLAASLGRAATLQMLMAAEPTVEPSNAQPMNAEPGPAPHLGSLLGIHAARGLLGLAGLLAGLGALLVSFGELPQGADQAVVAAAFVRWLVLAVFVGFAWSALDWFLEVAPVFAVRNRRGTFGALADSVVLFHSHRAACLSISGWLSIFRFGALALAGTFAMAGAAAAGTNQAAAVTFSGFAVLGYFLLASGLRVVRLAAYLRLASGPDPAPAPQPVLDPAPLYS